MVTTSRSSDKATTARSRLHISARNSSRFLTETFCPNSRVRREAPGVAPLHTSPDAGLSSRFPSSNRRRFAIMLPASNLVEIIRNLATLQLAPDTTAAVLGAVLAPLLRSPPQTEVFPPARTQPSVRRPRPKRRKAQRRQA